MKCSVFSELCNPNYTRRKRHKRLRSKSIKRKGGFEISVLRMARIQHNVPVQGFGNCSQANNSVSCHHSNTGGRGESALTSNLSPTCYCWFFPPFCAVRWHAVFCSSTGSKNWRSGTNLTTGLHYGDTSLAR